MRVVPSMPVEATWTRYMYCISCFFPKFMFFFGCRCLVKPLYYNFVVYQCQTSWHLRWPILIDAHAVIDHHPCANTMPGDVREPYSPRNRGGVRRNPRQGHATARGGARVAAEAVAEKRLPAVQGDGKVPGGSMGFELKLQADSSSLTFLSTLSTSFQQYCFCMFSYVLAWVLELQGLGKVLCAHSINHNMPRFEVLDIPCPWNKVVQLCVSTKVPKCWETHVRFEKPHDKLRKQLACSGCMASSPICFLDYWDLTGTNLKC